MVLPAGQITAFFENDDMMETPHEASIQLQQEEIDTVDDLVDFDKDTLKQVADNLRHPGGQVPSSDPNADVGATILTPRFVSEGSHRNIRCSM